MPWHGDAVPEPAKTRRGPSFQSTHLLPTSQEKLSGQNEVAGASRRVLTCTT